jgi:hypothetical protein
VLRLQFHLPDHGLRVVLVVRRHCLLTLVVESQISHTVLRLMRSAQHFWALFFHWQALLLEKVLSVLRMLQRRYMCVLTQRNAIADVQAKRVREKSRARGRKWDVVWEDTNIKHGIMERNYIDFFMKADTILRTPCNSFCSFSVVISLIRSSSRSRGHWRGTLRCYLRYSSHSLPYSSPPPTT